MFNLKKRIYLLSFVFLGILFQFIIHAIIEQWYINLLIEDFEKYSFGLSWSNWFIIHHIGRVILLIAGAWLGFWAGNKGWKKLYEKKYN